MDAHSSGKACYRTRLRLWPAAAAPACRHARLHRLVKGPRAKVGCAPRNTTTLFAEIAVHETLSQIYTHRFAQSGHFAPSRGPVTSLTSVAMQHLVGRIVIIRPSNSKHPLRPHRNGAGQHHHRVALYPELASVVVASLRRALHLCMTDCVDSRNDA